MTVLRADCNRLLQSEETSGSRANRAQHSDLSVCRAVPTGLATLDTPAGAISLTTPVTRKRRVGSNDTLPVKGFKTKIHNNILPSFLS